jgi:hypothetical protein
MSVCVYSVFVLCCVQVTALRRADPPSKESYRLCKRSRNWKSDQGSTKGCTATDRHIICKIYIDLFNLFRSWTANSFKQPVILLNITDSFLTLSAVWISYKDHLMRSPRLVSNESTERWKGGWTDRPTSPCMSVRNYIRYHPPRCHGICSDVHYLHPVLPSCMFHLLD